ncbi:MAG: hypothetical protein AAB553_07530 [Patescibacteria group bacterium]
MRLLLISTFFVFFCGFLFSPTLVSAAIAPGCQELYGGNKTCQESEQMSINATIIDPNKKKVDHITENAPLQPGTSLTVTIDVKNTHNQILKNITVTDTLPSFTIFVEGDGDFENSKNTVSAKIDQLQLNETKRLTFSAKVVSQNSLPEQSRICVVNQVIATMEKEAVSDNNLFCITNGAVAVKQTQNQPQNAVNNQTTTKGGLPIHEPTQTRQTPSTGPEALALFGLIPAGAAGMWLRKKTSL